MQLAKTHQINQATITSSGLFYSDKARVIEHFELSRTYLKAV
jgi:hypothetical protein